MAVRRFRPSGAGLGVLAALVAGCAPRAPAVLPPAPAKVSIGFGVSRVVARQIGRWDCANRPQVTGCNPTATDSLWASSWHSDRDVFLIAEPGLRGGRLSLGSGLERVNRSQAYLSSLRISLYRRWNTGHDDPGGTYLGVEGSAEGLADFPLGLRAGVFVRIAGPAGGAKTLLALDFPIWY
jgi:hypothetical protein